MLRDRNDIRRFLEDGSPVAVVTLAEAKGSTPRDTDAWMLVTPGGIFATIGGGQLEFMAIDAARALLSGASDRDTLSIPLGPEIGQCCGGHVTLEIRRLGPAGKAEYIEKMDAELLARPAVHVFGAGHVGHALAEALSLLPLRPVLIDTRPEALDAAAETVEIVLTAMPEAIVREAEPGSAFVILTHEHSLDFLIAREALARGDARYVGMIGSATKRASFERWLEKENGGRNGLDDLVCPIGNTECGDKRPAVIASFVAAEIMDHLSGADRKPNPARQSKAREGLT